LSQLTLSTAHRSVIVPRQEGTSSTALIWIATTMADAKDQRKGNQATKPPTTLRSRLNDDLRRSHPIPLRPPLVWRQARPLQHSQAGRPGGQPSPSIPFYPRRRHYWQRLHLRDVGKYLPGSRSARGPFHVSPSGRFRRPYPVQSP